MTIFNSPAATEHETTFEITRDFSNNAEEGDVDYECTVTYDYLPEVPEISQSWGSPGRPADPALAVIASVSLMLEPSGEVIYPDLDNAEVASLYERLHDARMAG